MLPGGSKTRSARQDGYFDKQFTRIMEAESYSDPVKRRRQERLKQSSLNLGHAFVPSSGEKLAYVKIINCRDGHAPIWVGQGNSGRAPKAKSRYYKERQVDRKKRKAIRW